LLAALAACAADGQWQGGTHQRCRHQQDSERQNSADAAGDERRLTRVYDLRQRAVHGLEQAESQRRQQCADPDAKLYESVNPQRPHH
jgi:hypothetical protein